MKTIYLCIFPWIVKFVRKLIWNSAVSNKNSEKNQLQNKIDDEMKKIDKMNKKITDLQATKNKIEKL